MLSIYIDCRHYRRQISGNVRNRRPENGQGCPTVIIILPPGIAQPALRVTPAQKLIHCPCLGVSTPQVPNCTIFTKYRVIIYSACLLLVLHPKVLSCFGFTDCKQIQIQKWSLLGAIDPIRKSVAIAFTSTQCLLYSSMEHGGSVAQRFCVQCNML